MQGCKSGTAMALLAALGVGLGAAEASAQQVVGCDVDSNGYVSADEAATCAERDYSTMVGDQEAITRERFEQAFPATENVDEMWADADANRDGQISRAEWSDWSARRFRSASPRVEGLSVDDYEALEAQYHMGDDQQGRDESVSGGGSGTMGDESGSSGGNNDGSGDSGGSSGDSTSEGSGNSGGNRSSGESGASGDSGDNGSSADNGSNGGSSSSAGGSGG
jgi:hypothetical protein